MIVDTSALIAILYDEPGADELAEAILTETALIPAPVVTEYIRVAERQNPALGAAARALLQDFLENGATIMPFGDEDAFAAGDANVRHGKGMGQGGRLNLLDLMVYGAAKCRDETLLCTGSDYVVTDLVLHPASRS